MGNTTQSNWNRPHYRHVYLPVNPSRDSYRHCRRSPKDKLVKRSQALWGLTNRHSYRAFFLCKKLPFMIKFWHHGNARFTKGKASWVNFWGETFSFFKGSEDRVIQGILAFKGAGDSADADCHCCLGCSCDFLEFLWPFIYKIDRNSP